MRSSRPPRILLSKNHFEHLSLFLWSLRIRIEITNASLFQPWDNLLWPDSCVKTLVEFIIFLGRKFNFSRKMRLTSFSGFSEGRCLGKVLTKKGRNADCYRDRQELTAQDR
jgi:hypothetical protein